MIAEATIGLGWRIHPKGNLICTDITRDWAGNFRNIREKRANGKKEKRNVEQ
jgi:hypothetical protein